MTLFKRISALTLYILSTSLLTLFEPENRPNLMWTLCGLLSFCCYFLRVLQYRKVRRSQQQTSRLLATNPEPTIPFLGRIPIHASISTRGTIPTLATISTRGTFSTLGPIKEERIAGHCNSRPNDGCCETRNSIALTCYPYVQYFWHRHSFACKNTQLFVRQRRFKTINLSLFTVKCNLYCLSFLIQTFMPKLSYTLTFSKHLIILIC